MCGNDKGKGAGAFARMSNDAEDPWNLGEESTDSQKPHQHYGEELWKDNSR
jgi:hypothetical protein